MGNNVFAAKGEKTPPPRPHTLIQENADQTLLPQDPIAEIEHLAVNRQHEYYAHYSNSV